MAMDFLSEEEAIQRVAAKYVKLILKKKRLVAI